MSLFSKSEYKNIQIPFILDEYTDLDSKYEKCLIDIEAYGVVDGEEKFFYSSFSLKDTRMYRNGDYESMLDLLRMSENKNVVIELKYRKGVLKGFRLKPESLAKIYDDERFLQLELSGWGINDKSCREM